MPKWNLSADSLSKQKQFIIKGITKQQLEKVLTAEP